ncbi:hypothetical protein [Thauera sp.]|uniref:hypothetical protein n=1 Tax=Thauera sp. TaxID=1905334 RepID=UPI0039E3748B
MKKLSLLLAGLVFSGLASAVEITAPSGRVLMTDCELLNEDVTINLTTGVVAGVACNDAQIVMSACHTAGRLTSRSADVTTCTDPNDNTTCTTAPQSVSGPAMPTASTLRGTVTSEYPEGSCSAGDAEDFASSRL